MFCCKFSENISYGNVLLAFFFTRRAIILFSRVFRSELNFDGLRFVKLYFHLEFESLEVVFVDFAEAEGVGDEAFTSFGFDEVFATLPVVESEANGIFVVVVFEASV